MKTTRHASGVIGGVVAALLVVAAASGTAGAAGAATSGNDSTVSISAILKPRDVVTGVRGTTNGDVILTGSVATSGGDNSAQTLPFLYQGPFTSAAADAEVSVLIPKFRGLKTATFYGPDTRLFNPGTIPAGEVRAVGSYQTSSPPSGVNPGVVNLGMIYLGPMSGRGGSWTSIDVPANGGNTADHVRACPVTRRNCFVMDTIAHSTMGNLVVGNYDLSPAVRGGLISANAFIYNMTTRRWTLLRLGGSLSSVTTLYGIWQDGGPRSREYTVAGGSSAHGSSPHGNQRGFLMNYNERTGHFGKPTYYNYGNMPRSVTHFEGITGVRGGFNLVAGSTAEASSMAFVAATSGGNPSFGTATWYPIDVLGSPVCSAGCDVTTGNTVYGNSVAGAYFPGSPTPPGSYVAVVSTT